MLYYTLFSSRGTITLTLHESMADMKYLLHKLNHGEILSSQPEPCVVTNIFIIHANTKVQK